MRLRNVQQRYELLKSSGSFNSRCGGGIERDIVMLILRGGSGDRSQIEVQRGMQDPEAKRAGGELTVSMNTM